MTMVTSPSNSYGGVIRAQGRGCRGQAATSPSTLAAADLGPSRLLPRAPPTAEPSSCHRQYDVLALLGQTPIVSLVVALLFVRAVIRAAAIEVRQSDKAGVLSFKGKPIR